MNADEDGPVSSDKLLFKEFVCFPSASIRDSSARIRVQAFGCSHGSLPFVCCFCLLLPDAAAEDHLHDVLVAHRGECGSVAEVELPLWSEIEIRREKDLVLLVLDRIQPVDRSGRAVIFD